MPSKTGYGYAPTPTPETLPEPSLGESINSATRPLHTKLNKLVVQRLRLALPPHADDAKNYTHGLLHIAPIYQAFESLWTDIVADRPTPTSALTDSGIEVFIPVRIRAPARIRAVLADVRVDGMAREAALRADLAALTGWSDDDVRARIDETARGPVLRDVLARVRAAVAERPHVLLAYAWVLYLALFAGGRFIRASLERAARDDGFWARLPLEDGFFADAGPSSGSGSGSSSGGGGSAKARGRKMEMPGAFEVEPESAPEQQEEAPLGFFRFATPEDGEDLKRAFKDRVEAARCALEDAEKRDVVDEARRIFEFMVRIVEELDEVCGTEYEEQVAAAAAKAKAK